jgi:hypothetical protein
MPSGTERILYGRSVTFAGTLLDAETNAPIRGRIVYVLARVGGRDRIWEARTDASGRWELTPPSALRRKTTWHAVYMGEEGHSSARTPTRTIYVRPRLSTVVNLPVLNGRYVVTRGDAFTLAGRSRPNLAGRTVSIQVRRAGSSVWHSELALAVCRDGTYGRNVYFTRTGRYWLRWRYAGGRTGPWLSAHSPGKLVKVVSYRVVGFEPRLAGKAAPL